MNIRRATVDDAEGVARVHVGTWRTAYRGIVPDDYLNGLSVEQRQMGWERAIGEGDPDWPEMDIWVAEHDGRIVGFCGFGPSRDGDAAADTGEVYAIYVDAPRWDTGTGAALMRQALVALAGRFREATLWVLDENARARRFYERLGWFFDGTTKDDDRGSFVLHEVRYRIEL